MEKSRDAFRTISEVAGWLDVPTHVLRFWESRFSQIKPVKRAGGRRYYRPSDMSLIGGIKTLLHDQGMTIRGVQKMLREQGIKHVSSFSPPLHADDGEVVDDTVIEGTAVPLEEAGRPVSIPAPAARATRDAEPSPDESSDPEQTPEEEAQPDMFPEPENDDPPAPIFAHRATEPENMSPAEETASDAPLIPDTPNVPDADPRDDDLAVDASEGLASVVIRMPAVRLAAKGDTIAPAIDRLKRLRARMSE